MENDNFFFRIARRSDKLNRISRWWFEPRATSRDVAFRERAIRSTLPILLGFTLLSFLAGIVVFENEWKLISFPTLHLITIVGLFVSGYAVFYGRINISALIFVTTIIFGASGIVILNSLDGSSTGQVLGIPIFMFVPLVSTLVLDRNQILPSSLVTTIVFALSQFFVVNSSLEIEGFTTSQQVISAAILLLGSATILRHLRVEFDARFQDMRSSMEQTEQAREEAELARNRAIEADNAKSLFLANISHELRTPLNAIIGYSEAMIGGMAGKFTEQQSALLGHIRHNGRRLLDLINDILDLSKIESGSLDLFLDPVEIRPIIRQTVESLRGLADDKNIDLTIEFDNSVPKTVLSDSKKLEQILVNLLSNAIKFTSKGGVNVKVNTVDSKSWRIEVRDSGIGMPANAVEYIFEPFRQVDSSTTRQHKGTGLGLAITKRLVDRMGGWIDVESELSKGTIFSVTLPIAPILEQNAEKRMEKLQ